jgi:predicted GH43/DUF377 family glycosyl hydrolase
MLRDTEFTSAVPLASIPYGERAVLVELGSAAQNWQLGPFTKEDEPCLVPNKESVFTCPVAGPTKWEEQSVFNPTSVVRNGRVHLLYRAEDTTGAHNGTSRIGLATSDDGLHFTRAAGGPVLYPAGEQFTRRVWNERHENPVDIAENLEWDGGCEDPRVVEDEEGKYYMTYTAYDGTKARLCVATSTDLIQWEKHGSIFAQAYEGQFANIWSKSGSVVCRLVGSRLVAHKIMDYYWMYWGEGDIHAATSNDLINWVPVVDVPALSPNEGKKVPSPVMRARFGRFDSRLVEPGPPAICTERGILLIYNAANNGETGDVSLPDRAYSAGQALFDIKDPRVLIARSTEPFMIPDREYETKGQVNHVCFAQGLSFHNAKWFLYYGTADSCIGVATSTRQLPGL